MQIKLDVQINGIPCQVQVDVVSTVGPIVTEDDYDQVTIEKVLDRKGYEAPWLEEKLKNPEIKENLMDQVYHRLIDYDIKKGKFKPGYRF